MVLTSTRPVLGIRLELRVVDAFAMLWPVAALAVFFLGFAVVYGSVLQSRHAAYRRPEDARPPSDPSL